MKIESLTDDLYALYDGSPPHVTLNGVAITDNDNVLAIVGVANIQSNNYVICGVKNSVSKRMIIKAWEAFKDSCIDSREKYYAVIDNDLSTAPKFLSHFGFEHYIDDIYIYRG